MTERETGREKEKETLGVCAHNELRLFQEIGAVVTPSSDALKEPEAAKRDSRRSKETAADAASNRGRGRDRRHSMRDPRRQKDTEASRKRGR